MSKNNFIGSQQDFQIRSREVADFYQEMFNYFSEQHGLPLTISEMDEIIWHSNKVVEKHNKHNGISKYCNCLDSPQRIEMSISRCAKCNKFIED